MDITQILNGMDTINVEERFTQIYQHNLWQSEESISGMGSELQHSVEIRKELPTLLRKYDVRSMLDIPCGDYNWMKHVDLGMIQYIGADIVKPLIESNRQKYPHIDWRALDIINDDLPKVDLVFVRDCLGHLCNDNVHKALENLKRSGSKYLLATSFARYTTNTDVEDGGWKPINLMCEPFLLKPIYLINEEFMGGYPYFNDKCMILFPLNP